MGAEQHFSQVSALVTMRSVAIHGGQHAKAEALRQRIDAYVDQWSTDELLAFDQWRQERGLGTSL